MTPLGSSIKSSQNNNIFGKNEIVAAKSALPYCLTKDTFGLSENVYVLLPIQVIQTAIKNAIILE